MKQPFSLWNNNKNSFFLLLRFYCCICDSIFATRIRTCPSFNLSDCCRAFRTATTVEGEEELAQTLSIGHMTRTLLVFIERK